VGVPEWEFGGMSDQQSETGAGAGTGTATATTAPATGGNGQANDQALTDERSANKQIKDFAKAKGVSVADLLARYDDLENATKSEVQRAVERAADWERKYGDLAGELKTERAEKAIRDAAAGANARADRLGHIWRMVKDEVAYDPAGKASNVTALIEQARKDSPEWFQAVSGSGDGGKTGETGSDPNASINAAIRRAAGYGSS
jgi:hypothetical protein